MRRSLFVLVSGLAAHSFQSHAQTGPLATQAAIPDTIVTGTRVPTPQERVPAATTVITRQEIEERGYISLAEALNEVPGMRLAPTGGFGSQVSAFVRGTSSRSVLVLMDGVPVNDPSEPNGAYNFGQDLLFDVERIEVLRGPASSLYGSAAVGGVINIVTRRATEEKPFTTYGEFAGGTQNTLRGGLGATGKIGQVDYLFSGYSLSTAGFNQMAPRFNMNIPERDGVNAAQSTGRLGWQPNETTRVEGLFRWRDNRFGLDNVPTDDPFYSGQDIRYFGQIRGETALLDGAWTTGLRLGAVQDKRSYTDLASQYNFDTGSNSSYRGQRTTADWGNTVRLPDFSALREGTVAFGVSHAYETAYSVAGTPGFQAMVNANQHTTAGWSALQYQAFERLDLTAGLRHDSVTGAEGATTWRSGAVLALPEIASRLRAAVGTSFAAPALFQRYGVIPGFFVGNPGLKPETATSWEIGAETDLRLFGRAAFLTPSFTFFQSWVRDLISYAYSPTAGISSLVNVDRANIHGAELGVTLRPSARLQTTIAWTITEAFDSATGLRLPRRPETMISLTGRWQALEKVVVAPTVLFTGRSPEAAYASYANDGTAYPYPRYNLAGAVVNVGITWQAMPQASLVLDARNLLNSKWEPVNGFVIPGPSVVIGTRFAL